MNNMTLGRYSHHALSPPYSARTYSRGARSRKGRSVAEGPDAPGADTAEALAYVCGRLDYLRAALPHDEAGEPPALRALLNALSGAHDLTGPLDALHADLLNAGDALGVWGHVRSGSRHMTVPG